MKKKLGLNAVLNMIKSVMGMLFPLVTYPYVSRILSVENIGKVNFSSSVVSYFLLFAMLGIQVYATREGARIRENKEELNTFVSEVFTLNVGAAVISVIIFSIILLLGSFSNYRTILLIYILEIPLTVIGTDWINSIFEDYFYITVRTIVFQVLSLFLIFLLVRTREDYHQYAVCLVISAYGAGIINAFYTRKYAKKRIVFNKQVFQHLKPTLILFATNLAALIYSSADTTMLGIFSTDYHVGIYSTSAKVYNIFKQLVFAVVIVCLPRFSYILANEGKAKYEVMANKIYKLVVTLSVPLAVGIFFLSKPIILALSGPNYVDAIITLRIKSFAILFAVLSYFNMQLVLLPNKKDSVILKATLMSGLLNVVGNFFLIPRFVENGAAFTTVVSELVVLLVTYIAGSKIIKLRTGMKNWISIIVGSTTMGIVLHFVNMIRLSTLIHLLIGFVIGVIVYFVVLLIFRNEVMMWGIYLFKTKLHTYK